MLAALGAAILFYSLVEHTEDGEPVGKFAWRPIVFVLGANIVFGILLAGLPKFGIPAMGLIMAIYALVIIASLAGDRFVLRDVLILATTCGLSSMAVVCMRKCL